MVRNATVWIFVAASSVASIAHAEEGDGGRAAYVKATRYFEAEEFVAALPYFEQAYEQSGRRPATIFGLAQCLRSLRRYADAVRYFEEYLATEPDNADEVRETLGLLEEIAAKQRKEQEAEAKRKAEEEQRAAEAEARREREETARREAEREAAAAEAEARARLAAEAVLESAPPPPAPQAAAVVTTPEPEPEDDSILSSPVFWILTGAAVVGGAVAVGLVATSQPTTYGGTADVVLRPLGGR